MAGRIQDWRSRLDAELIAAHEAGDWAALVSYYRRAADQEQAAGNVDACCFFLTQAYVFALQSDDPGAADLHARLKALGREE